MRLGDLLVQKGHITPEQLQTSLHEQSRFGGRLGTNLIQLGYVDVDTIALMLSDQQALPPVLREHIAAVDRKTLSLFPAKMIAQHKVVPIGYTLTKPGRVVVAAMTPATVPTEELAFAAGRRIEVWVAPEAIIQECMERYFGAPPMPMRYVSVKFAVRERAAAAELERARTELLQRPSIPASDVERRASLHGTAKLTPPPPPRPVRTLEMPDLPARPAPPAPPDDPPRSEGTPVSWDVEVPPQVPIPEPSAPESVALPGESVPREETPDDWDIPEEVVDAPPQARPITAPPEALQPVIDRAEASRMLEMATTKEQIGRVLENWLRSTFGCGLVLVVKGDMAIGWKGFFPDAEDLVEAVAIPLGKPSMFAMAHESRAPFRGAPPAEGAKLQERLWKLLRCAAPAEALVCPVSMGKRTVNLVYAHMEDGSAIAEGVADDAAGLCAEAAAAYARLIGRGKR